MRNLKRVLSLALAAMMLIGMMVVSAGAASTYDSFTDKDEIVNTEAVNTMVSLGVLTGKPGADGTLIFDPTATVKRGEMAKIIAVALNGGKEPVLGNSTNIPKFSDVPTDHWAYNYIAYCVQLGIIAGHGDGTFAPEDPVTGSQAAKMFLCALGYRADLEGLVGAEWELNTNILANQEAKLYEGLEDIMASEGLTRDSTAQMAYNAVQAQEVVYDNLEGSYEDVLQTYDNGTMLYNRFKVVKVTGILEANDKMSVLGNTVALEGKSLLNVSSVTGGPENANYSNLMGQRSFAVETSDEMVGQEIVLYVRFQNDLAPNAANSTVIGEPILTDNNTVVETSARLKDTDAVRSTLRAGGMSNVGTPVEVLYTENTVSVGGTTKGVTDSITAQVRGVESTRSAGIFQRFIDNDGNGTPDYIIQIVPVLTAVNSISTDGETYTFTGINGSISAADIVTDEELARNDVVLVNKFADDCYYVSYPETVEGTVSAFDTNNNTVLVDGTSYGNSGGKNLGVSGVDQILTEEETIDNTFIFYMDPAGNVLGYKETAAVIGNYAIVKGYDRTGNTNMGYSATVKLLMQDGTTGTYSLNLAASAVNLGLAEANESTQAKEDAITIETNDWVGDSSNSTHGTKLVGHLFSYTLENNTVTLSYANEVNDNYSVNLAGTFTALSKNIATYNGTVANDQTVFFIKDSEGDTYVVTGLSKLAADSKTVASSEIVSYTAPGTTTAIAKAIFVTLSEKYQAAREYVYVTDKYVRTTTSGTPIYSFTVVYPDGTTAQMETKSNVNTIKNKVCEYDYDGSYVNFYPTVDGVLYNELYVKSVANNTVTLGDIDTGATVTSLRINSNAAIWDVQDEPVADALAENDIVSLIVDTEGAVKAAFIYDVMNGTFVDNPLNGENGSSITVNGTKLTAEGQVVETTLVKDQVIPVIVTIPNTMSAPKLSINDGTPFTMSVQAPAARAAVTLVTYQYDYVVTEADVAAGSVSFEITLSQSGLDSLTLTWTVGNSDGSVTPPAEGEYTVTVTVDGVTDTTLTKNVKEGEAYTATYTAPEGKIIASVSANGTIAADKKSATLSIASVTKAETIAITLADDEGTVTPPADDFDPELVVTPGADGAAATATMNYYLGEGEALADKANWIKDQLNANGTLTETVEYVNISGSTATALDAGLNTICTVTLTQVYQVSLNGTVQGYSGAGSFELTDYTAAEGMALIDGKDPTSTTVSVSTTTSLDGSKKNTVTVSAANLDLWSAYELNLSSNPAVAVTAYQVEGGQKTTDGASSIVTGHYVVPGTQIWVSVTGGAEGDLLNLSLNGTTLTTEPLVAPATPFTVEYANAVTLSDVDATSHKYELAAAQVYKLMMDGAYVDGYFSVTNTDEVVLPNSYATQNGAQFVQITSTTVSAADTALVKIQLGDGKVVLKGVKATSSDLIDGTIVLGTAVKATFTDAGDKLDSTNAVVAKWRDGVASQTLAASALSSDVYFAKDTVLEIKSIVADSSNVNDDDVILVKVGSADVVVADKNGQAANQTDSKAATATYTISGTEDLTFSVGASV